MFPVLALATLAGILITAGWRNQNVIDVMLGRSTENPHGRAPDAPVTLPDGTDVPVTGAAPLSPNPPTGGNPGTVTVAPGAMKPGTTLDPTLRGFVALLSGLAGRKLTIGTGTNHNRMTTSGNVSDHYPDANGVGHAADIPATGSALTRLGRIALIAAGMPRAQANQQTGGLFNLQRGGKRIQIIFNSYIGGNHYTHLHVGIR